MKIENGKNNSTLVSASPTEGKKLDLLLRRYHKALWNTIDRLAAENKLSVTALANKAKMDPKLITRSLRETENGDLHWPSLSTINRLYAAVSTPVPFVDKNGKDVIFKSQITPQDQYNVIEALVERYKISPRSLAIRCNFSDNIFEPCRKNKDRVYAYETPIFVSPFVLFDDMTPFLTTKLSEITDEVLEFVPKIEKPKKEVTKTPEPKTEKIEPPTEEAPRKKTVSAKEQNLPETTIFREDQESEEKMPRAKQEIVIPLHKKAGADWVKEKTKILTEYYAGEYLVKMHQTTYTVAHEAWRISPSANGNKEEPGREALDTLLKHDIMNTSLLKLYQFCEFDITNILSCIKTLGYGLRNREEIMTAAFSKNPPLSPNMLVNDVRTREPDFARFRP